MTLRVLKLLEILGILVAAAATFTTAATTTTAATFATRCSCEVFFSRYATKLKSEAYVLGDCLLYCLQLFLSFHEVSHGIVLKELLACLLELADLSFAQLYA